MGNEQDGVYELGNRTVAHEDKREGAWRARGEFSCWCRRRYNQCYREARGYQGDVAVDGTFRYWRGVYGHGLGATFGTSLVIHTCVNTDDDARRMILGYNDPRVFIVRATITRVYLCNMRTRSLTQLKCGHLSRA